jgi:hypothetical protein
MHYQPREFLTAARREFGQRSVLFGALFILTLIVGGFVDLDGVLEYFKVIAGSPFPTLETGAIISMASAAPFLAMGMSISAATHRKQTERD